MAAIKQNVIKASLYDLPSTLEPQKNAFLIPQIESNRIKGDTSSLPGEQTPTLHYLNFGYPFLNECLRCRINVKDAFRELIEKKVEFDSTKLSISKLSPTEAFQLACVTGNKTKDKSDITSGVVLIISTLNILKENAKTKLAPFLKYDKYAWEHLDAAYEEIESHVVPLNQGDNATTKQIDAKETA